MIAMAHRHGAKVVCRRRAVGRAHARGRPAVRLRLLRVLRAQDLRARPASASSSARPRSSRHAALAGRRQHDQGRDVREDDLQRSARAVRGGHRQRSRDAVGLGRGARLRQRIGIPNIAAYEHDLLDLRHRGAAPDSGPAPDRHRARKGQRAVVRASTATAPRTSARALAKDDRGPRRASLRAADPPPLRSRSTSVRRLRSTTRARRSTPWAPRYGT